MMRGTVSEWMLLSIPSLVGELRISGNSCSILVKLFGPIDRVVTMSDANLVRRFFV